MDRVRIPLQQRSVGRTVRTDSWRLRPLAVAGQGLALRCSIDDGVVRSYSDRRPGDDCRFEGAGA